MIKGQQERITSTLISQSPREGSGLVAVFALLLLVVVSQLCWRDASTLQLLSATRSDVVQDGQVWKALTTIAIHADVKHLIANGLPFLFFSYLLYGYFGPLVYPLLTFLLGAVANYVTLLTYPDQVRLIGASGVVYLMVLFWLVSYLFIERRIRVSRRLLRALGFGLVLLIPTSIEPQVSYRGHAIGAALGVAGACLHFWLRSDWIREHESYREADPESAADEHEPLNDHHSPDFWVM